MEIINESVLVNRENLHDFLAKILTDQEIEEKQMKEYLENFNKLLNYNS